MSFLINAIASILVFSIVIFIHELGHFVVAKLSGIKVNEFSLGMGPKLYSRKKSEKDTAYSIRALPIGGFVSMEGEDDESEEEKSFTA
ncbi:MAG: site-2 protease family protein [Oscillospiraceae bacterium]